MLWAQARFDPVAPPLPDGFVDIDDFIEELAAEPQLATELAAGRRELAGMAFEADEILPSALRLRAGLSQRELAARIGTTQSCVARFEKGTTDPQLSTIDRYATALDVSSETVIQAFRNARNRQQTP